MYKNVRKEKFKMNVTLLLREQVREANNFLQTTAADVTQQQADWMPPGIANPLGALYAHALTSQDGIVHTILQGGAPLFASVWQGKTGINDPQIQATREWARAVKVDVRALREYASAVAAASDAYLTTLKDDDVQRVIDLTTFGLGQMTVYAIVGRLISAHLDNMTGEISCLKGLQGAKGYPI
jgi:hypothetical protein